MANTKQNKANQPADLNTAGGSCEAPAKPAMFDATPVTSYRQPVKDNRMITFRIEGDLMPKVGDIVHLKTANETFIGSVYEIINGDIVRLNQRIEKES